MNKFKFKNVKMKYQSTLRKNTNIFIIDIFLPKFSDTYMALRYIN